MSSAWLPSCNRAQKFTFQAMDQPVPPSPRRLSATFCGLGELRAYRRA